MALNAADQAGNSKPAHLQILVVDDDELNRRMMRILLMRDGHDVEVAANGVEALEAVKHRRYDIVFMDLQMPIMGGIEASRRIREWENGDGHTYIVALTASYMPENGPVLFEAGIDNYVSKPFEVEHIQHLLSLIVQPEGITPNLPAAPAGEMPSEIPVLNIQKGTEGVGGDLETYRELLSDFIQELPERIRSLQELFQARKMMALAHAAHNLKGVSANLGALQLSDYANKLDKQSNEGYTDLNQALLLDLKRAEMDLQKTAADFLTKKERTVPSA